MTATYTKEETINEIVKQARKLNKLELQILLTKLRVRALKSKGVKMAAFYQKDMELPSLEDIDLWKHQSRK